MLSPERTSYPRQLLDKAGRVPASLIAAGDVGYEWDLSTDRIVWWGAVEGIFGGSTPVNGSTLSAFIEAEDKHRRSELLARPPEAGGSYDFEFRLLRPDGTHRWITIAAASSSRNPGARRGF